MKCPHCGYEDGWVAADKKDVTGEHGRFYYLPVKFEREGGYVDERADALGCPACNKIFLKP